MENLKSVLNGLFLFKEWSSHQSSPKEFANTLNEFGYFKIYNNFKELLQDQDHYLVDSDGNTLDIEQVLSSAESFSALIEDQFTMSPIYNVSFEQINEPILYAQANDTTEPVDFIELVRNIELEDNLIAFINEVLVQCGEVTHSTGIRNKYEVISIDR